MATQVTWYFDTVQAAEEYGEELKKEIGTDDFDVKLVLTPQEPGADICVVPKH